MHMTTSTENQCLIEKASQNAIEYIVAGIIEFNDQHVPATHPRWTPIELALTSPSGETVGGILGGVGCWGGLEIKLLWVAAAHRGKGLGKKLLAQAESQAKEEGAMITMLDTFDFQAKDFYVGNGYQIAGQIEGFFAGHQRTIATNTSIQTAMQHTSFLNLLTRVSPLIWACPSYRRVGLSGLQPAPRPTPGVAYLYPSRAPMIDPGRKVRDTTKH